MDVIDSIDRVVEAVSFISAILGMPDGHESYPDPDGLPGEERRWFWSAKLDGPPVVHLVLEPDGDLRVELGTSGTELNLLSLIGWCATHAMPCYIFGEEVRMVVVDIVPDFALERMAGVRPN